MRNFATKFVALFVLVGLVSLANSAPVGSSYVPVSNAVYGYLDRCVDKGLIPARSLSVKPVTRVHVAEMLLKVASQYHKIDDKILETELDYFLREYSWEALFLSKKSGSRARSVRSVKYSPSDALTNPHRRLLSHDSDEQYFVLDPIATIRRDWKTDDDGYDVNRRSWGLSFFGDVDSKLGYYFRFVDHTENGNPNGYYSRDDLLEDHFGYVGPLLGGDETYYDQTDVHFAINWNRLALFFGKDRPVWGPGEQNLMLGSKGPSYTNFRASLKLNKRFSFHYLLGKLHPWETLGDTLYTTDLGWTRIVPSDKWIAAHRFDFSVGKDLSIGLSEALIWGDRGLDPAYLIPLNFLYSAEHDGGDLDNVMLNADIAYRFLNRGSIYGSLFIDDLNTSTLGEDNPGNKFGFTSGIRLSDLEIDGLYVTVEYARLQPFVYSHFYPVNRYTHWTASLGSDLKPNSDQWNFGAEYRPLRSLIFALNVRSNRHGSEGGEIEEAIPRNSHLQTHFLSGEVTSWTEIETRVGWEFYPGATAEFGWIKDSRRTSVPDRAYLGFSYRYQ